eukprot:Sdes_comp10079_c0_seq1m1676
MPTSGLEQERALILENFQSVTGLEDVNLSKSILEHHQWKLEDSVIKYFNEFEESSSNPPPPPETSSENVSGSSSQFLQPPSFFQMLISLLISPVHLACNILSSLLSVFQQLFFPPVLEPQKFVESLEKKYGAIHPHVYDGLYSQALEHARRETKILLAYFHSSHHLNSDPFCRNTLCTRIFSEYVDSKFIFWGGDVSERDAYRVFNSYQGTTFPFLCVSSLVGTRMATIGIFQGPQECEQLIEKLENLIQMAEPMLVAERTEREERNVNQRIRQEQDLAYHESLQQDREKQRQREEAELRKKKQAEEEELEIARILKRKEEISNERKQRFSQLTPEPSEGGQDIISIGVKLPNGDRIQRRFHVDDSVVQLYDFVGGHSIEAELFSLSCSYPKRDIPLCQNTTLRQAGLLSNSLLLVRCEDD